MPIHMGIMCEACGVVHFVATSPGIKLSERVEGMYWLTCKAPCPEAKMFRKEAMRPYRVGDDMFNRGYAEEGEYELVEGSLRKETNHGFH
jgi:hypothetical protein